MTTALAKPRDPFSEVVDQSRRWTPDWYTWLDGLINDLTAALPTTGDTKFTFKTVADPGWVLWSDGTIGNVGSGSSIRADADTSGLFTVYYNGYSDAACPLLTSTGVATTRAAQGTNTAAFNANCRMSLPKGSGRGIGLAGAGTGLTPRLLGDVVGAESVVQTVAQMPSHSHGHSWTQGTGETNAPLAQSAFTFNNFTFSGANSITGTDLIINTAGSGQSMNVMNPMTYINVMIKL